MIRLVKVKVKVKVKVNKGSDPEADEDASECRLFHLCGCNLPFRIVRKCNRSFA